MKVKTFDGGLNTRVDAHLIKNNEARIYKNIDSDTAVLTPIKDKTLNTENVNRFVFFSTVYNTWYSSSTPTDYLEYRDVLYQADRLGNPVKIIDNVSYNVGIAAPAATAVATQDSAPQAIERITLAADFDGGADLPVGTHKYKIVNRSATTGKLSYSYYEIPTEEVTVKPKTKGGRPVNTAGTTQSGLRYGTHYRGILATGENRVTITFDDTNAEFVRVYRYFDGAWRALTASFQGAGTPVVDDTYDISANDELEESELITGTIQYALTFYSNESGSESKPTLLDEVDVVNGTLDITGIPTSSDPQVDTVRIYRIGGNITSFSLVDTISNGTSTYTDDTIDTDIVGTLLASQNNDVAPSGLKYLKEAYAMLFGALNDKLRFTPIGQPDAWPTNFFLDFPSEITGISKTAIGLLVHTYFQTFLVTGTGPTAFAQQVLANDQGCVSHDSIQETKDTALWVSTDGICASDGSDVKVLSRDKLGKQLFSVVNAVLLDQVYQVLLTSGDVIALDFDRGIFKEFNYDVDYLATANDMLFGHKEGNLYALRASADNITLTYQSPDFVANGLVEQKVYSDVQFYLSGTVTVTVYINGIAVGTYTKSGVGTQEIKLPSSSKRGNYISFLLTGTGVVRELEWTEASANA